MKNRTTCTEGLVALILAAITMNRRRRRRAFARADARRAWFCQTPETNPDAGSLFRGRFRRNRARFPSDDGVSSSTARLVARAAPELAELPPHSELAWS